jgi:hypothetical protein
MVVVLPQEIHLKVVAEMAVIIIILALLEQQIPEVEVVVVAQVKAKVLVELVDLA